MHKGIDLLNAITPLLVVLLVVLVLIGSPWPTALAPFEPLSNDISGCQNTATSGIYTLINNLTGNQSHSVCIDIQADNVVLDCAGWNITGNITDTTYGIYANGRNNTT
ncbi:MAG: hypothetical protein KQA33_01790, partial [Candidatus Aenigmarchaeota archaeon]|nr:hypothetical protein [Candidatus Aenigmarchaeota archaeon]